MALHATTTPEKTILRTRKQFSYVFLAGIEMPTVIFTCKINQEFASNDQVYEFAYDTPVGTYTNVQNNMTAWIGSAAGLYDLGMARIRKTPTSNMVYIGETSEISWQNDLFITVVDEFSIWAKHVYIDPDDGIVYMDRDVLFTDQHIDFDPVPIMGCDAVADVVTYPVGVNFPEADDSWVFDSTITGFQWYSSEGVLTNDDTSDPTLTIESYPTNGRIRVALDLTAANGKTFRGYRHVYVYDPTHLPFKDFILGDCSGDFDSGGFSFEVTMLANATRMQIHDRTPITLFKRDFFGGVQQQVGQLVGRENIKASGWVDGESILYEPASGTVTFTVQGPQFWLDKIHAFPPGVAMATDTPAEWLDMPGLTVDRALWHLFHWRSTLTTMCDVHLTGDDRYATALAPAASTLWQQVREIAFTSIFAIAGFDPFGRLFVFIHPQLTPEADRTWATIQTLDRIDWQEKLDIKRVIVPEISMLSLSGIAVNSGGSGTAFFALGNGHIPKHLGIPVVLERLLLSEQAQTNELCGLYMGWKNNELPNVRIPLAQNNSMFTLFPAQFAHLNVVEGDTVRGISFSRNFMPIAVSFPYNNDEHYFRTDLILEAETFPEEAVNGDVPGVIDVTDIEDPPDDGTEVIVPIDIVILPPTETNLNHPRVVVVATNDYGVFYTETFDAPQDTYNKVTWIAMNDGLDPSEYGGLLNLVITPNGNLFLHNTFKVWAAPYLGGTWSQIASIADFNNGYITSLAVNPNEGGQVIITGSLHVNGDPKGRFVFATINGLGTGAGVDQIRMHTNKQGIVYCDNKWYVVGNADAVFLNATYWLFNAGGSIQNGVLGTFCVGAPGAAPAVHLAPVGTSNTFYYWTASDTPGSWRAVVGVADALGFTALTTLHVNTLQGIAPSPTGQNLMAASWYGVGGYHVPYKSTDSGASWQSVAGTIPVGSDVWENCRDNNRWIFGGGATIRLTLDHGATYFDKMGNLGYVAPLCDIFCIRFIE